MGSKGDQGGTEETSRRRERPRRHRESTKEAGVSSKGAPRRSWSNLQGGTILGVYSKEAPYLEYTPRRHCGGLGVYSKEKQLYQVRPDAHIIKTITFITFFKWYKRCPKRLGRDFEEARARLRRGCDEGATRVRRDLEEAPTRLRREDGTEGDASIH